jgi:gliding motility-associated-like protein
MKKVIFTLATFCLLFSFAESEAQVKSEKLNYIENKGQWPSHVSHMAKIGGGSVWLEKNKAKFVFIHQEDAEAFHEYHHHGGQPVTVRGHAYELKFIQPNPDIKITSSEKSSVYHNYFRGSDQSKWAANVGLFAEVKYEGLFNGIDLRFHSQAPYMKYDYIVHPGADVNLIKWQYSGITPSLENGKIILRTTAGDVVEDKPVAWQIINGIKTFVACEYKMKDDILQFNFPNGYASGYELIIDPTLIFSSYSGATGDNWGYTATYDNNGNLYSGSIAFGSYPITSGAFQTGNAGGDVDASISKFNSTGTNLLYSTYLGGSSSDAPHSLFVDANDNLYIYGTTGSNNFPVTAGCYDNTFNGGPNTSPNGIGYSGSDIFITCLNASGNGLVGSTYVGGTDTDGINEGALYFNYGDYNRGEIIVADNGDVLVASSTFSTNFPTTAGSLSQINSGGQEGVAFRMNPTLTTMVWSTYIGGSTDDAGYGLKESGNGVVYVTGGTQSVNFPITVGALQTVKAGGIDAFIISFNGSTGARINGTYLGTASYDQSYFLEIDNSNDIYVLGQTKGTWPVTGGVYSNNNGRQFIHKLNPALSATIFSTRFGSGATTVNISPNAFLVDNCYNIYVSGWGGSTNTEGSTSGLPVTPDAYDAVTDGSDFYFMVLERDAQSLLYGSFFGGSPAEHVDGGTSRFDRNGIIYQAVCAGCGGSDNFPTQPGVWSQTNNSTNCNIGVIKMEFNYLGIEAVANASPNIIACDPPYDVNFNGSPSAVNHIWNFGDGTPNSTQLNPTHTYTGLGNFTVMYIAIDSSTCNIADTAYLTVQILQPETFSAELDVAPYDPCISGSYEVNLAFTGSGADSLIWDMGDGTIYNDSLVDHIYSAQGTYIISMTAYDFTCNLVETITDTVSFNATITTANADAAPNVIACDPPYDVNFTGSNNPDHFWDFGDGSAVDTTQNPSHTYTGLGNFTVMYIGIDSSTCNIADTVYLSVQILQPEVFSAVLDVAPYDPCTGGPFEVNLEFTGSGADSLIWDMGDGNIYNDTVVNHFYSVEGLYIISLTAYDFTCNLMETITDTVYFNSTNTSANANASPNIIACDPPFLVNFNSSSGTPDHFWDFDDGVGTSTQEDPSYTFTSIGNYDVMYVAIDSSTCNIADTVYLSVQILESEEFSASFTPIPPQPCSDTVLVNVVFTGTGADQLTWDMGDGTIFTNVTSINYAYTVPGVYTMTMTAVDLTCNNTGTISQTIEVADNITNGTVYVPNVITPNGDNINEKFKLGYLEFPGLDPMGFMEFYEIKIYNRWGKLVFESSSATDVWDGKIDSDEAVEGVYYYILNYQRECLDAEPIEKTGYVTVLRQKN